MLLCFQHFQALLVVYFSAEFIKIHENLIFASLICPCKVTHFLVNHQDNVLLKMEKIANWNMFEYFLESWMMGEKHMFQQTIINFWLQTPMALDKMRFSNQNLKTSPWFWHARIGDFGPPNIVFLAISPLPE